MSAGNRSNLKKGIEFGIMETEKLVFETPRNFQYEYNTIVSTQTQYNIEKYQEINKNKAGSILQIIDYINSKNITVLITSQLPTGDIIQYIRIGCCYQNFKNGEIASPYDVNFYGHGYTGEGPYNKKDYGKHYMHYCNMMLRSYDGGYKERNPTYIGVHVDPYFYNFQNFAYWTDLNYYTINNERMNLDKDILYKGNKVYSPLTCMYVPEAINKLFLKNEGQKFSGLPLGCTYSRSGNNYQSNVVTTEGKKYLGKFQDPIDAFFAYKTAKEEEIKKVANIYMYEKGGQFIPQFRMVYDAMMSYTIEIDD